MPRLEITYLSPATLKPRQNNPRQHPRQQIARLAAGIEAFGLNRPIGIDRDHVIVYGHALVLAAQQAGLEAVPVVHLEHLSKAQARAFAIADNRLAELSSWDEELLAKEFLDLSALDLSFDLEVTGFETAEIDVMILGPSADDTDPADDLPPPDDAPTVTQVGDIWQIGPHRLICGDATDAATYVSLLDGVEAQLVFTDPPYNVKIDGHVSGLGKVKHREFAMASGEMSVPQFTDFLAGVFGHLAAHSVDGAVHFVCMDWRHTGEVLAAGEQAYTELKNLCVWSKTNGGMGSLYRSQHEFVFVFKSGAAAHINNVELGRYGRNRTNVWTYPGVNSFGKQRDAELAMHPTVKPVALVADAILDCSRRNGIVLDVFAGSGTTLVAAERTGRRGYGVELDPRYCDVILKRMAKVAGSAATLAVNGKLFDDVRRERTDEMQPAADSATPDAQEAA